ncbi:MAG: hypothetical protein ACFFKA_19730 [Candidatus Thorarchaeota archaeon]
MARKVDDLTYSKYLLQALNIDDLKQICRGFEIKGFSNKKKIELIDFILDSLSEEELKDLIKQEELVIISEEIDLALKKINGLDRESLDSIKVVNEKNHEIELYFKGWNWDVTSYLSIKPDNINDPERDCDCRIGSNMGFCSHFWIGFIFSLKEKYFKLSDWTLTALPKDFEKTIQSIKISAPSSLGDKAKGTQKIAALIDESSDASMLMKLSGTSVTLYEGEVTEIVQRQSDFQGNITTYYHITLKDVRLGPRVTKKKDIKQEDIFDVKALKIRISDTLHSNAKLVNGLKISVNGKLEKDNFWGFLVKNIRKVDII